MASYHSYFETLTQWASSEDHKADLLVAKQQYFAETGEVFEDDRSFEMRMAAFLDYFLLERPQPSTGRTPAQELLARKLTEGVSAEEAAAWRSLTESIHGLFEVRKVGKQMVRLRELFSGKDHDVTERRQIAGLEKGDILEARLIPFGGLLFFSQAFCFHPREANKSILKEIKRRKKKEADRPALEMVRDCSRRALKADRYRQIAIEKIYDFVNSPI